jgi:tetratricopeptide (TPR) repeat protein
MSGADPRQSFKQANAQLRAGDAVGAVETCRSGLAGAPTDVDLLTLLGVALLTTKQPRDALPHLEQATALAPRFVPALENLGKALLTLGRFEDAAEQLQRAASIAPSSDSIRLKLAHALAGLGRGTEADEVFEVAFGLAPERGKLATAGEHLRQGRPGECEAICRDLLKRNPEDVNAMRLLAKVEMAAGRWRRAENVLYRALQVAPAFDDARLDLARVLKEQDRVEEAVDSTGEVVERNPRHAPAWYLHASMLAIIGQYQEALAAYERAIALRPQNPTAYIGMGHLLKTLGRQAEGIAAYRSAIEQQPDFAEVYWSLANLKTFRFTAEEVRAMEMYVAGDQLDDDARIHFLFTLGKAYEDQGEFEKSFDYYQQACARQRMRIVYDPVETQLLHERIRSVFSAEFIASRAGQGCDDPAPIFIVGLPRSGSTLIEQILASHSQVEGTAELPDVARVIGSLGRQGNASTYPEAVVDMEAEDWWAAGESYLLRTERHRRGLPRFTDKMPNNFANIGMIKLMLPNARIIDARRHPLDSCFGSFKQHFALGQAFSYDLEELGEFYLEYRAMMRHWHRVLPGQVLELRYEDMVADQLTQTRRLLDFCGLPWEESCLRFHETERAVRTASSEQVRQPIYSSSINHWRHFQRQLQPLMDVLGSELDEWDH